MGVIHTEADGGKLDENLTKPGLVVIDFSAEWCGPCRFIAPKFEDLSNQYATATFVHVDIDKLGTHPLVAGVRSVPTFFFYKNGSKVAEFSGADENKLKSTIEAHL